ncbi:hypothetical protein K0U07_03315 [bacterium]|nr:hypothetical protein [bacterium]
MSKYTKISIAFLTAATCFTTQVTAEEMHHENNPNKPGYGRDHRVPPAQPLGQREDNLNFFVGASYTYWLPYNSALALAFGKGRATERGNTLSPATQGVSGFKVSAGTNLFHDGWHARANYTWFLHNPGLKRSPNVSSDYNYIAWGGIEAQINYLDSRYYVFFNRVDACINRNYFIGDYVVFRPWLGLLGAWDSQFVKANNESLLGSVISVTETKMKQDWWGVGPYAGGEATYCFTDNIGLFIQSGAAILYAQHHAYTDASSPTFGFYGANRYTPHNVEPMFELSLGMRWDMMWDEVAFRVDLAWEMQTYLEHISFPVYSDLIQNFVDYSMQGLTVSGRISF